MLTILHCYSLKNADSTPLLQSEECWQYSTATVWRMLTILHCYSLKNGDSTPLLQSEECWQYSTATVWRMLTIVHYYSLKNADNTPLLQSEECWQYSTATVWRMLTILHCYSLKNADNSPLLQSEECWQYSTATVWKMLTILHCYSLKNADNTPLLQSEELYLLFLVQLSVPTPTMIGRAPENISHLLSFADVLFWVTQKLPFGDLWISLAMFCTANYDSLHAVKRINTDLWSQNVMFMTSKCEGKSYRSIKSDYTVRQGTFCSLIMRVLYSYLLGNGWLFC